MKVLKIAGLAALLAAAALIMTGCLASQYKEYHYRLNDDGSGSGTIKFVNIVSQEDNGEDVSSADFDTLVNGYIEGTAFEDDNPNLNVTKKKLYEEGGVLVGEVSFTFDNLDSIGFFRDPECRCSPVMFYLGVLSETFVESNGTYLGKERDLPILTWNPSANEFYFKTTLLEDMSNCHALLSQYQSWKEE